MSRNKYGGIKIKDSYEGSKEAAIDDFMKNSDVEFFHSGHFGIILKFKAKNDFESPYESLRYDSLNEPIKELLIKILLVNFDSEEDDDDEDDDEDDEGENYSPPLIMDIKLEEVSSQDFKREVNVQDDIFKLTNDDGKAICPAIVYESVDYDIDLLKSSINNKKILKGLNPLFLLYEGNVGLIAMEILPKFTTLYNDKNKNLRYYDSIISTLFKNKSMLERGNKFSKNENLIKEFYNDVALLQDYEVLDGPSGVITDNIDNVLNPDETTVKELALIVYELIKCYKIGYIHGDFHFNNILFNKKEKYIRSIKGRALLIDFGYAMKIDNSENLSNNEIIKKLLFTKNEHYGFEPYTWVSYQWLNYIYLNDNLNKKILDELLVIENELNDSKPKSEDIVEKEKDKKETDKKETDEKEKDTEELEKDTEELEKEKDEQEKDQQSLKSGGKKKKTIKKYKKKKNKTSKLRAKKAPFYLFPIFGRK